VSGLVSEIVQLRRSDIVVKEKIDNRNPERVILLLEKDGDAMLTLKG
jgi:hypothetical protein